MGSDVGRRMLKDSARWEGNPLIEPSLEMDAGVDGFAALVGPPGGRSEYLRLGCHGGRN